MGSRCSIWAGGPRAPRPGCGHELRRAREGAGGAAGEALAGPRLLLCMVGREEPLCSLSGSTRASGSPRLGPAEDGLTWSFGRSLETRSQDAWRPSSEDRCSGSISSKGAQLGPVSP